MNFYRENGYLVVDRITTDEELAWLDIVLEAFAAESGGTTWHSQPQDPKASTDVLIEQHAFPEITFPELLETTYRRNAKRFAAALLDVNENELTSWSHIIRKPAIKSEATPWHQDEAYWDAELEYTAVAVWLPLHDVTVERGCMQFIPGSHRDDIHLHSHSRIDLRLNLLWAEDFDTALAVACPLRAGGATFHHPRVLHYTAPNTTDQPRTAFPMEFQTRPVLRATPDRREWAEGLLAALPNAARKVYVADGKVVPIRPLD